MERLGAGLLLLVAGLAGCADEIRCSYELVPYSPGPGDRAVNLTDAFLGSHPALRDMVQEGVPGTTVDCEEGRRALLELESHNGTQWHHSEYNRGVLVEYRNETYSLYERSAPW